MCPVTVVSMEFVLVDNIMLWFAYYQYLVAQGNEKVDECLFKTFFYYSLLIMKLLYYMLFLSVINTDFYINLLMIC